MLQSWVHHRKSQASGLYLRDGISERTHECNNSQHCCYSKGNSCRDRIFRDPERQPWENHNKKCRRVNLNKWIRQPPSKDKLSHKVSVCTCKNKTIILKRIKIHINNWNIRKWHTNRVLLRQTFQESRLWLFTPGRSFEVARSVSDYWPRPYKCFYRQRLSFDRGYRIQISRYLNNQECTLEKKHTDTCNNGLGEVSFLTGK